MGLPRANLTHLLSWLSGAYTLGMEMQSHTSPPKDGLFIQQSPYCSTLHVPLRKGFQDIL